MAKRLIVVTVVVLVLVGFVSFAYSHYRDRRNDAGEVVDDSSGAVVSANGSAPVKSATRSDTGESGPDDAATNRRASYVSVSPAATAVQPTTGSTAPATDTIAPNPPNGTVFAGSGKFQVYRQGDLTWRLNTENGRTCILFATEEEWRKPIVYRNGCGRD